MPVINRLPQGGDLDFSELTPHHVRGTDSITNATIGHRYLVACANLNTSGSAKDYWNDGLSYGGFTEVEIAKCFGDGSGNNSNQRARGALIIGKASSTTLWVNIGVTGRACAIWFDLDQ